jgi:hypothetical protein
MLGCGIAKAQDMNIVDPIKYSGLTWPVMSPLARPTYEKVREAAITAVLGLRPAQASSSARTSQAFAKGGARLKPNIDEYSSEEWITPGPAIGLLTGNHKKNGITITLVGEAHRKNVKLLENWDFDKDETRARHLLGAMGGAEFGSAPLVIIERGLDQYTFGGACVREPETTAMVYQGVVSGKAAEVLGYNDRMRSMMVAGYILAVLEANPITPCQITLFFGDNHWDIVSFLEEYADAVSSTMLMTQRHYLRIGTQIDLARSAREARKQELLEEVAKNRPVNKPANNNADDDDADLGSFDGRGLFDF